jgi:hypothetical protein
MQAVACVICDRWLQLVLLICAVDRVDRSRAGLKVLSVRHRLVLLFCLWPEGLLSIDFGLRSFWRRSVITRRCPIVQRWAVRMCLVFLQGLAIALLQWLREVECDFGHAGYSYDEDVSSIDDRHL